VKRYGKYGRKVSWIVKIWKIWKKRKMYSDKIWKAWKKDKLNSEDMDKLMSALYTRLNLYSASSKKQQSVCRHVDNGPCCNRVDLISV
jgi:hypothetical protein